MGSRAPIPVDPFRITPYPEIGGADFADLTGRVVDTSNPGGRTLTLLVGPAQSNAANSLNGAYTPASPNVRQINLLDGNMYRMQDPMLGTTGTVGGWPSEVGQKLIDAGFGRVVWLMCSVGGSTMREWSASRGQLFHRLAVAIKWARIFGLTIDGALTMLGETDASLGTLQTPWVADALDCYAGMAGYGFNGKIIISQCTASGAFPTGARAVRAAQAALVDPSKGRYAGPDIDTITDRYDTVHLNVPGGRESAATLWANTLISLFP